MYTHQTVYISDGYRQAASSWEEDDDERGAGGDDAHRSLLRSSGSDSETQLVDDTSNNEETSEGERKRGRVFAAMGAGAIFLTWMLFITSAWMEFSNTDNSEVEII